MFASTDPSQENEPSNVLGRGPYRRGQAELKQRLVFTQGASRVTIESMDDGDEVIDTDFDGAQVHVSKTARETRIGYEWSFWTFACEALFGDSRERPHSTLRLNRSHIWDVQCRGGLAHLDAHLEEVSLSQFSILGGVSRASLALGPPKGVVPIRIRGGVSQLDITRPEGVGVRLSVRGGISRLSLDTMELDAVGGGLALKSLSGADADNRYEIEIAGGVSNLMIG